MVSSSSSPEKSNRKSMAEVKSLFAADNPFRRKPQSLPAPPVSTGSQLPTRKKGDHRRNPNPKSELVDVLVAPERKEHVVSSDIGGASSAPSPSKRKKKRKRDEPEDGYELAKYGGAEEPEPAVGEKRKASVVAAAEAAASRPSKESFDDDEKLLRTVFVGNLPPITKRKSLIREFKRFGDVESARIRCIPLSDTTKPRKYAVIEGKLDEAADSVHAYVVFKEEQSARAALMHNMAEVGGKHIRVDMACPPRKKIKGETSLYDRKKTVFVGNLPYDVKVEELYDLFHSIIPDGSSIEGIRVIRDPSTSVGKGIAYVLFKTRDAANKVVKIRDLEIRDRPLRVFHAKADPETSKPPKRGNSADSRRQDFPNKRPAPSTSGGASAGSAEKQKVKSGAPSYQGVRASVGSAEKQKVKSGAPSYQGVRASKSGVMKKAGPRPHPTSAPAGGSGAKRSKGPSSGSKVFQYKRPAVAARKEKSLMKRKQGGTPEGARATKKAKR